MPIVPVSEKARERRKRKRQARVALLASVILLSMLVVFTLAIRGAGDRFISSAGGRFSLGTGGFISTSIWPPFTMVAKVWQHDLAVVRGGNIPGHRLIRIEYRGNRDWRTEIIEDSFALEAAGSWTAYDGGTMKTFDAIHGERSSRDVSLLDQPQLPADWLEPKKLFRLVKRYAPAGKAAPAGDKPGAGDKPVAGDTAAAGETPAGAEIAGMGTITFVHEEKRPCSGGAEAATCVDGNQTVRQVFTVRSDDYIPVGLIETVGDQETRRVTVLSIAFQSPRSTR